MAQAPDLPDAELARLLATGTGAEVRRALDMLVDGKRTIEAQLSQAKAAHAQRWNDRVTQGQHPAEANLAAKVDIDPAWRMRALRALTVKERQIRRLRQRLTELTGAATQLGKEMPERRVVVIRGKPEAVADEIQEWLDDGWSALNSVPWNDALLVVFRKDFEG